MEPRISLVTLGVSDLERATRFYEEVLHLPRLPRRPEVRESSERTLEGFQDCCIAWAKRSAVEP